MKGAKKDTKLISCKVGTKPALIHLYRAYKIRENLFITFRYERERDWHTGRVWKVLKDGFFFVELM